MVQHPSLYEINTRVWLRRFDRPDRRARLADVPDAYWDYLAALGFDCIWLMGVWETVPEAVPRYCLEEGLVRSYREALPDWRREDTIGSPYAIDDYRLNPQIATREELAEVRRALHRRGLRLILDFIPNHFHAQSSLVEQHPELFIQADADFLLREPQTFYRSNGHVFAHGKDPYFPAWQDTVQVNYFEPAARAFMTGRLLSLTEICDGVRCDMAILALSDVLENTWGALARSHSWRRPAEEFWSAAIAVVKQKDKDFTLIAEAYWGREWYLQQLGFDFTYDKKLTDRLQSGKAASVRDHLRADISYQEHSVRFLENHDEDRALAALGNERTRAAAVIVSTLPGMRFFHHGQLEGRRVRLPVQLGREADEPGCACAIGRLIPDEATLAGAEYPALLGPSAAIRPVCRCLYAFYDQLLRLTAAPVFREGVWQLLEAGPAPGDIHSCQNLLVWQWRHEEEFRLIVVNYADHLSRGRIPVADLPAGKRVSVRDLISGEARPISIRSLREEGLPVELPPYRYRIFSF